MKTGKSKQIVCVAATAALLSGTVQASTYVGGEHLWSNANGWNPMAIPGRGTETDAVVGSGTVTADSVYPLGNFFFTGGTLDGTLGSNLTVANELRLFGGDVGAGATITANGPVRVGDIDPTAPPKTINNAGTIVFAAYSPSVTQSSTFNNNGLVTLGAGVTFNVYQSTTTGQYTGAAGSTLRFAAADNAISINSHVMTSTASIVTAGAVEVADSNFHFQRGASITASTIHFGGVSTLFGAGTFNGTTTIDDSTPMYPGEDFGDIDTLHFNGETNLINYPVYEADLKVAGGVAESDLLDIEGHVTIDDLGMFAHINDDSEGIAVGTRFHVLHASAGISSDDVVIADYSYDPETGYIPAYDDNQNVVGSFTLEQTPTDIYLVYTPEPTALLPIGMGLLAMRRRRLS